MIRVAIVDDHPAVRLGLHTALRSEPGLVPVGAARNAAELAPLLYRVRADVVLLDYHLPDVDGLTLCRDLKAAAPSPGVILYSGFADRGLVVPAILAGADGLVDKGMPAPHLYDAIRTVAGGGTALPAVEPAQLQAASTPLDEADLPILGMLVDGASTHEIAETLRMDSGRLTRRIGRMLDRLTPGIGHAPA